MKVSEKISYNHSPIVLGVSLVAGLGVIMMILALGFGVVQGEAADSTVIGLLLVGGAIVFILGAGSWFAITQPQKHFDNISIPMEAEPHHDHTELAEHSEPEHQTAGH